MGTTKEFRLRSCKVSKNNNAGEEGNEPVPSNNPFPWEENFWALPLAYAISDWSKLWNLFLKTHLPKQIATIMVSAMLRIEYAMQFILRNLFP